MKKMIVYVVEDDINIKELEIYALESVFYTVKGFSTGTEFWEECKNKLPDLIILDIMLPDEDGLSILKKLRTQTKTNSIPVIMVTAKTTELDKIKCLDMGADDYIVKPFSIMEMLSRVKALLRRTSSGADSSSHGYSFKSIVIDEEKHIVTVDNKLKELTYKEFELLKKLISHPEMVFTRQKLLKEIWDFDLEGETRTLDMHIRSLRKKLGEAGGYIKTVRNVGYKISEK